MAKKKKIEEPSEIPLPANPEIVPERIPEEPVSPEEEPEITPDKDPDEPSPPPELPKPNKNQARLNNLKGKYLNQTWQPG